ncbi:hypothetical protein JCM33774_53880 [Actinophytocola sp. KF-1]
MLTADVASPTTNTTEIAPRAEPSAAPLRYSGSNGSSAVYTRCVNRSSTPSTSTHAHQRLRPPADSTGAASFSTGASGIACSSPNAVSDVTTAPTTNSVSRPNGAATPAINGPSRKPATAAEPKLPIIRPAAMSYRLHSADMPAYRAGVTSPSPMPHTNRPASNVTASVANAVSTMPAAATFNATHATARGRHRSTHHPPTGWNNAFAAANNANTSAIVTGPAPTRSSRSGTNGISTV